MVRSGPDRGLFWRPFQKTGPYGPAPPDCGPVPTRLDRTCMVRSFGIGTGPDCGNSETGPYSPVSQLLGLDHTVQSKTGLRLVVFAFLWELEPMSITPRCYSRSH